MAANFISKISSGIFSFTIPCFFLLACGNNESSQQKAEEPVAPPQANVAITKIDDAAVNTEQKATVGQRVSVEGIISDPNAIVCVLVHPMTTDTWWVQNPPSPPTQIDENTWRWRTMVYCGTETLGLNEDFEIVVLAEGKRAVCQKGKQIKGDEFPNELPRSEIITVFRGR